MRLTLKQMWENILHDYLEDFIMSCSVFDSGGGMTAAQLFEVDMEMKSIETDDLTAWLDFMERMPELFNHSLDHPFWVAYCKLNLPEGASPTLAP